MDASGAQIGWASFSDSMGMLTGTGAMGGAGQVAGGTGAAGAGGQQQAGQPGMVANGKVLVTVQLQSTALTPGFHGMHMHTIGNCGDAGQGPFTAAGGHLAITGTQHPLHNGDFPAILINADGTGYVSFETDRFTMADLLDADSSAIIIHALPDNYANIPSRYGAPDAETLDAGDSGDRVACGAVQAGIAGLTGPGTTGTTTMGATTGTGATSATGGTTGATTGTAGTGTTGAAGAAPTTDPNAAPTTDPNAVPTATAAS